MSDEKDDALATLVAEGPADETMKRERRRHRHTLLFWQLLSLGAVVVALAVALIFTSVLASSNSDLRAQLRAQTQNAEALRNQVLQSSEQTPKVSQSEIDKAAKAAAAGIKGQTGDQGDKGAQGDPGQNATDDQVARAVTAYCASHGGCTGPAGANGANASPDMVAVAVAAYCAANGGCTGPAGPAGANGATGADGAAGEAGPAGASGEPPASWTYTDNLGFNHTCTRTDPFDAAAPTYTCK